jgi:MiaB-like tRNA modifying enzyme
MRVFVKSFGCSANLADGEALAGCLAEAGFELTFSVSAADAVIYNTCAVKGPTEDRIVATLKRVPQKKKVIVAGCLPLVSFERLCREVRFDGAVGPAAAESIVNVVKRVLEGDKVIGLEGAVNAKPVLSLPRLRSNPVISILPVSYGCLGACAYCCVVFARGRLRSYTVEEVIEQVRKDLAAGAREFWITSQDVACYGRDIGTNIATLLNALGDFEDDFRVRVGMMTPNMTIDILDDLVEAFKNERIYKFVHLPVQSGDDEVLKRMQRFYTAGDFIQIVDVFRTAFPEIALATDVVCGFPGETRQAFENTLRAIGEVKPDIVNVSKFFARPRTAAAEMGDNFLELAEIRRRSSAAALLARRVSFERNQRWKGWTGKVLIDEKGKIPGTWIGRNFAYKPITVRSSADLLGKTLYVKTRKAFSTYLEGTIC